jgi:hypothetical protein
MPPLLAFSFLFDSEKVLNHWENGGGGRVSRAGRKNKALKWCCWFAQGPSCSQVAVQRTRPCKWSPTQASDCGLDSNPDKRIHRL